MQKTKITLVQWMPVVVLVFLALGLSLYSYQKDHTPSFALLEEESPAFKSAAYNFVQPNMEIQVPTGEVCPGETLEIPVISRILGLDSLIWSVQCGFPHPLFYAQLTYEFTYTFEIAVIGDSSVSTTPTLYTKVVTIDSDMINVYNNSANTFDLGNGFGIYFNDTDYDCTTDPNCPSNPVFFFFDDSIYTNPSYYPTWTECESSDPKRPDISGEWQPNWQFMLTYYIDPLVFTGGAGGSVDFANSSEYGFAVFSGFGSYLSPAIIPGYCFPCGELATGTVTGGNYYGGTTTTDELGLDICFTATPLRLKDFDLEVQHNEQVYLDWNIYKDPLNTVMELQRSEDGESFSTIMTYDVHELTTGEEFGFEYLDYSPKTGSNYYRIRMTDSDGFVDYSNILHGYIHGEYDRDVALLTYPNPATTDIRIANLPDNGDLLIYNPGGRLMISKKLTGKEFEDIQIDHLSAGTYLALVNAPDGSIQSTRFIKN